MITVPDGFDPEKESLPMVVFLHDEPESGEIILALKKKPSVTRLFSNDPEHFGFRVITLSPLCKKGKVFDSLADPLMGLIDAMAVKYNACRVALTGIGMGGFGAWSLAMAYPEKFAAIAPVSGGGMTFLAERLKNVPVLAFHGTDDTVVSFERSKEMVDAVNASGGQAELRLIEGKGHDIAEDVYELSDELMRFLVG